MTNRWQDALAGFRRADAPTFWRGLDELAETPEFRASLVAEFPALARMDLNRRDMLRAVGASLAFAGVAGCEARPDGRAVPYVEDPEHLVPGRPRLYATGVPFAGIVQPVLGITIEGRPIKLEGNPDHPASRGATDAFTQAALLDLYDPDRSQGPRYRGEPTGWADLDAALAGAMARHTATQGAGLRILAGASTSPTLQRQWRALLARLPRARLHLFEPIDDASSHEATRAVFGRPIDVVPLLDRAEAAVLFNADPLGAGPRQVRDSLGWAARRRAFQGGDGAAAWMVSEPSPTLSGGRSHDRLVASPDRIDQLVGALAAVFGVSPSSPALTDGERQWVERAAKLLAAHRGRGLVLVGPEQSVAAQALGWAIDRKLGNLTMTSRMSEPLLPRPAADETVEALHRDLAAGQVESVVIVDCNPVYAAAGGAAFGDALRRAPFSLHVGVWFDETAAACQWHAALSHPLESWSDGHAADGSAVIIQPLVRPLTDTRPLHRLVAALDGDFAGSDHAIVQQSWAATWGTLQPNWVSALEKGLAPEPSSSPPPVASAVAAVAGSLSPAPPVGSFVLLLRPDPTVWDGRLANNPWAQENPKPMTTLTWDNAVLIAPASAASHHLVDGDEVRLSAGKASVTGPVWVMPGQDPRVILVHRGYGRQAGEVAKGAGFDVGPLLGQRFVTMQPTGGRRALAAAQQQQAIEGDDLIRTVAAPRTLAGGKEARRSFYPAQHRRKPSWGMAIDLDLCTGCGACVTACNAENNIPMVGRDEVRKGRRMHWLRLDRYYEGDPAAPAIHVQPLPCMHCEDAPCESGCPVNATVHSPEGVNVQVYNRCIGTRTCSSYCPYKVRRFNWHDYHADESEGARAQHNPNVTVRARGVMEKCNYCLQRISAARIAAKIAGAPIADGAVKTACQQVCPTGAISFGDLTDGASEVTKRKADPRDYTLLDEANTRPRTSYAARIRSEDRDG